MKYGVIFRIGYRLGGQSYSFRQREALMGPMQYPMHLGQMRVCTITAIGHLAGYISHNSALADRRSYLIDSGFTSYFMLNVPANTMCTIFVSGSIFQVLSLSEGILVIESLRCTSVVEGDYPIIVPYNDQRYIAIRFTHNTSKNIRAMVLTAHSNVTRRPS